jgi:hypothetical protein
MNTNLTKGDLSRRTALKRIGAGGAVAWSAPAMLSVATRASAGSLVPGPGNCSFPVTEGQTITFSNLFIGACDAITLGALRPQQLRARLQAQRLW